MENLASELAADWYLCCECRWMFSEVVCADGAEMVEVRSMSIL
jgi:hypothetical protein